MVVLLLLDLWCCFRCSQHTIVTVKHFCILKCVLSRMHEAKLAELVLPFPLFSAFHVAEMKRNSFSTCHQYFAQFKTSPEISGVCDITGIERGVHDVLVESSRGIRDSSLTHHEGADGRFTWKRCKNDCREQDGKPQMDQQRGSLFLASSFSKKGLQNVIWAGL